MLYLSLPTLYLTLLYLQSVSPAMAPLLGRGPNISIKIKTKEVRKDLTQLLGREAGPR